MGGELTTFQELIALQQKDPQAYADKSRAAGYPVPQKTLQEQLAGKGLPPATSLPGKQQQGGK